MKLSRFALGLAVRATREAAGLSSADLAKAAGLSTGSLSRTENGQRDLGFAEVLAISQALGIEPNLLTALAESMERAGAAKIEQRQNRLQKDLNDLQQLAIETAIASMAEGEDSAV